MNGRTKHSNIKMVSPEVSEVVEAALPLLASSTFCDDVRLEASGKFSMIGCYPGNIIAMNPAQPVSQLWVFTRLMWGNGFNADGFRLRVDLPAQDPGYFVPQGQSEANGLLVCNALYVWQLKFHPLRIGDVLRISVEQGPSRLACGELMAVAATQHTRH